MSRCISPIVARQSIGRVAGLVLAALLALAGPATAQNLTSGSIDGVVSDETGGAMPGVTITATSRALQVPNVTTVTDGDGRYRLIDLPPGSYQSGSSSRGFNRWCVRTCRSSPASPHASISR